MVEVEDEMKKVIFLLVFTLFSFTVSGCSWYKMSNDEEQAKWLDVELTINPEKPQPNEEVTFAANVVYGDEAITDAEDVTFEIWRANDEKHQKFTIKEATGTSYQTKMSFDREGTYYVIAHVLAEGMHNMPKKEFVVGSPSEPEAKKSQSSDMMEEDGTAK